MSPLCDFACPNGHRHERLVPAMAVTHDVEPCPECGLDAVRQIAVPAKPIVKAGTPTFHPKRGGERVYT